MGVGKENREDVNNKGEIIKEKTERKTYRVLHTRGRRTGPA